MLTLGIILTLLGSVLLAVMNITIMKSLPELKPVSTKKKLSKDQESVVLEKLQKSFSEMVSVYNKRAERQQLASFISIAGMLFLVVGFMLQIRELL